MENIDDIIRNLDTKRMKGDTAADEFIKDVIVKHELKDLNTFFAGHLYNNQLNDTDIPKDFLTYINQNSHLPEWADMDLIDLAQQTFTRIGPAFVLAYFCKSLPQCYACGKGAEILYKTGRLTQHTRRRIAQTAQFVLDVMTPGGLESDGRGIATAIKVRLMHASIRYYFLQEVTKGSIDYDIETIGKPINQEDLLGTMLSFSYVVIEGINKLGVEVSDKEREAILHLWKCVGYLIGIEDLGLIQNFEEASMLWKAIETRQYSKSIEGAALTSLLIDFLDEILKEKVLDDIVPMFMYSLMDKKVVEILGIRKPQHFNPLAIVTFILGMLLLKLESKGFLSKIASHYVNMKLMIGLEKYIAEGEDTSIYIPPNLKQDWHFHSVSKSLYHFMRK